MTSSSYYGYCDIDMTEGAKAIAELELDREAELAVNAALIARGIDLDDKVFQAPATAWGRSSTEPTPIAELFEDGALVENREYPGFQSRAARTQTAQLL